MNVLVRSRSDSFVDSVEEDMEYILTSELPRAFFSFVRLD